MAEQNVATSDNPIFIYYGDITDRSFAPHEEIDDPAFFFPQTVQGVMPSDGDDEGPKRLVEFADPAELKFVQKTVAKLREALRKEAMSGGTSMKHKLEEFRTALSRGNEAMLDENPFYELSGTIYRLNLTAVKKAFAAHQKETLVDPPKPIKVSRSYRQIWFGEGSMNSFGQKMMETQWKLFSFGKMLLGLLLFVGSTLTTAKGVNDLLQHESLSHFLGGGFSGDENETARLLLAVFTGLVVSSVILDFKDRLFQGVAEAGQVFKGFWLAFKRNPRWIFISIFLTMISIWTNYDGIVLLFSQKEDLTIQWEAIEQRVERAVGDPKSLDADRPDSLLDLQAMLQARVSAAVKKFNQVPDDERFGAASSGVAKKGPRYWGKYYAISGGYKPGVTDVATTFKRRSRVVPQIDRMLRSAELDLTLPLKVKMDRVLTRYNDHLAETRKTVDAKMSALGEMMAFKNFTPEEVTRAFSLESYHINQYVQDIVADLEKNKEAFSVAATEINRMADGYIQLLQAVDKAGGASRNEYRIDVKIDIPPLDAIDQLKKGEIPMA
ncbi:MAG: hypothetical protein HQL53_07715, partial [Magnetococcales bacterium]|nr:hypothetical protein [Magnetococcales bacterium]